MSDALKIEPKPKIVYIDHLRVALTALVVLHHAAVTYGAPGGWYYSEKTETLGAIMPMTLLVSVDQAFFMGFFFLLSALFIPVSLDKKGPGKFMSDRLVRLGIPLMFYSFVFSPFVIYIVYYWPKGHHISYGQFLSGFDEWINFGVMWFVAALLIFSFLYVLFRIISGSDKLVMDIPTTGQILIFATAIGIISFFVRIVFPVGRTLDPLGFQLGHFPQYIAMFIFGIIASRNNWLGQSDYKMGKQMRLIAILLVVIGFPLFFIARKIFDFPIAYFSSGMHWPQLWYAVWEQVLGFSIATALLCIGRAKWDVPSPLLARLARCAFAAYIFHPIGLVILSSLLKDWAVDPGIKFLVVGPLGVVGAFALADLLVKIPGVNRIL
ncbi:acyltransferase family protein [Dyadobacter luticola]|uniref:Acyltransferase n=1 Tax=Dyadobacter luticola TaxID=1979387 RepID=A0A5R9L0N0_9BACT|nr:acyltransferase [Dyadobacter luticola]TLV02116.1 acyltransferase [Dyadobacter luticola]